MHEGRLIAIARGRAGMTLRELGARARTSHSTLSAYEHGWKAPSLTTLDRILRAAGATATVTIGPKRFSSPDREREFRAALRLAAAFPARHRQGLAFPPMRRR